ncbi:hypothetical protein QE152_g4274 [Popillia japonica]|uniref:Uncharacterized protein n=1 Tax=Popillia japonica TaxID=7064 RepID=A0AAW1MX06_POPJA
MEERDKYSQHPAITSRNASEAGIALVVTSEDSARPGRADPLISQEFHHNARRTQTTRLALFAVSENDGEATNSDSAMEHIDETDKKGNRASVYTSIRLLQ